MDILHSIDISILWIEERTPTSKCYLRKEFFRQGQWHAAIMMRDTAN